MLEDEKTTTKKIFIYCGFFLLSMALCGTEDTFGELRSIVPAVPLPSLFSTQVSSLWGRARHGEGPDATTVVCYQQ